MADRKMGFKFSVEGVSGSISDMNKVGKSLDELLAKSQQNAQEFTKLRDRALSGGDQTAADKFERQRVAAAQRANDVIASSYRTLGVTSTASQEAYAKQQISAYKAIRDSGVASYEDILKAQEALNKKLQSSQAGAKFYAGSTAPNYVQNFYGKQGSGECDPCESADKIVKAIERLAPQIGREIKGNPFGNAIKGLGNAALNFAGLPFRVISNGLNTAITGALEGVGRQVAEEFGAGLTNAINARIATSGVTPRQAGAATGEYLGDRGIRNVDAAATFFGYEKGIEGLKKEIQQVGDALDGIFDPDKLAVNYANFENKMVKILEDIYVYQKKTVGEGVKELFDPAIESAAGIGLRAAGMGLKVGAQPFRIRKRVELARSADEAKKQAETLELENFDIEKAKQAESVTLVTGGIDFQKGGVNTDFASDLFKNLIGKNSYVQPVTNPWSNDVDSMGDLYESRLKLQALIQGKTLEYEDILQKSTKKVTPSIFSSNKTDFEDRIQKSKQEIDRQIVLSFNDSISQTVNNFVETFAYSKSNEAQNNVPNQYNKADYAQKVKLRLSEVNKKLGGLGIDNLSEAEVLGSGFNATTFGSGNLSFKRSKPEESRSLIAMQSLPEVPRVFGANKDLIAMEKIQGVNLKDFLLEQSIPLEAKKEAIKAAGAVLARINASGFAHNDLDPSNIILESGTNRLRPIDFATTKRTLDKNELSKDLDIAKSRFGANYYTSKSGIPKDEMEKLLKAGYEGVDKESLETVYKNSIKYLDSIEEIREITEKIGTRVKRDGSKAMEPMPLERLLQVAVEKGFNPDAIKMAASAMAVQKQVPDKPINLVGTSGGSYVVEEAISILERAGVKGVKGLGVAAPFAGLTGTASPENFQGTIGDLDDLFLAQFGVSRTQWESETELAKAKALLPINLGGLMSPTPLTNNTIPRAGLGHAVMNFTADPTFQAIASNQLGVKFNEGMTGQEGIRNLDFNRIKNQERETIPRTFGTIFNDPKAIAELNEGKYAFFDANNPDWRRDNDLAASIKNSKIKVKASRTTGETKEYADRYIKFIENFQNELTAFYESDRTKFPESSLQDAVEFFPELEAIAKPRQSASNPAYQDKPAYKAKQLIKTSQIEIDKAYNEGSTARLRELANQISSAVKAIAKDPSLKNDTEVQGLKLKLIEQGKGIRRDLITTVRSTNISLSDLAKSPKESLTVLAEKGVLGLGDRVQEGAKSTLSGIGKGIGQLGSGALDVTNAQIVPTVKGVYQGLQLTEKGLFALVPFLTQLKSGTQNVAFPLAALAAAKTIPGLGDAIDSLIAIITEVSANFAGGLGSEAAANLVAQLRGSGLPSFLVDQVSKLILEAFPQIAQNIGAIGGGGVAALTAGTVIKNATGLAAGETAKGLAGAIGIDLSGEAKTQLPAAKSLLQLKSANPSDINKEAKSLEGKLSKFYSDLKDAVREKNTTLAETLYQSYLRTYESSTEEIDRLLQLLPKDQRGIVGGVKGRLPQRLEGVQKFAAKNNLSGINTVDVGQNIVKGLEEGIDPNAVKAIAKDQLAEPFIEETESLFEIQSPSKWGIRVGKFIKQGLGIGLDGIEQVSEVAAEGVKQAFEFGREFNPAFMEGFEGGLDRIKDKFTGLGGSIKGFAVNLLAAFGVYSAGDVLIQFGRQIFETTVKFERLENVIKNSSGSSAQFGKNIGFLNSEISRLNIDKATAFEQYGQLSGALRGTALEGDAGNKIFGAVAQAGQVQGLDPQRQQQTFLAITQIISKGQVQAEELRGQLSESLPQAYTTFAKALGVTTAQLNAMLKEGKLGNDELLKFAAQLKSDSDSGVAGAADLAQNKINRLSNAFTDLQIEAGKTTLPLQKFGLDIGAYLVDGLAKGMGFIRVAFIAVSAGLISYGFNLLLAIARTELFSKALAFLGVTSTKTFAAMALSMGAFIGKLALLGVAIEGIRQLWDASFDPETSALTKLVDQSVTDLKRLRGEIVDTQGQIADPSWMEQFSDTLVGGINQLFENAPSGNKLVTFADKRKNDLIAAREGAVFNSLSFLNDQDAGIGFGTQSQKVAQDRIDALTSQIQALKAKETSGEILASDRKGIEDNIKAQKALTDERAKLQQKFADQNSFVQSQITLLNRFREGLIKTGATSDDFRVKNLDSVLSLLNKSAEATSNLMNRVANGLAEINKNIRDLNESSSAFNENLDRQATAFKLQQANQNLGSNFSLPSFALGNSSKNQAIARTAANLGVAPEELAAIIAQESSFNPSIKGGDGGNYHGLFQWGASERANELPRIFPKIGVNANADITKVPFEKQLEAFELWAKGRGFKAGMGNQRLYATILGGNPYATGSDSNGTVAGNNPSINKGGSNYNAGLKFLSQNGATPISSLGNLTPKSSETLASEQTLADKKIAEARLKRSQEDYNKLVAEIQKSPNTLSNARAAGVFDENNIPNRETINRLLRDSNTDKDTIASLETLQKYIAAGDNLTKATEDLASKEIAYRQTRKDISFQADDAKRAAANEKANQSFANKIAEIGAGFDLQIERTLDETQKKVLQSNKELAIAPLDQQLKLQQERQKLADLQIKKARYDQGGYPFGVDANSFGAQIANQNTLITSLEKQNKLALDKLKIQRQNLDIETKIAIANERRTLQQQLALDIQKQTSDRASKAFSRGLRDSPTEYNPDLAASQQRFNEEKSRIDEARTTLNNTIENAQVEIDNLRRIKSDAGVISDKQKALDQLKTGLVDLNLDEASNIRQKQIEDRLAIATGQIKALNNISTFAGLRGDIANIQADRLEKLGGDIFSANKIRLAAEALKIQTELNIKLKEFDKLIQGTAQERSLAGFGSVGEVIALRDSTIELSKLKLDGLKDQFKDLGATIADSADKAFGEFFDNIFDGTKSIGDAFRDMAVSILKSLANIASEGFFSTLKNLFGMGGSPNAGFAQLLGGGISPIQSLFSSTAAAAPAGLFGPGFSSGGYTGDGNKFDPAGIVHKGEFVVSADRVRNIGAAYLDSLTAMRSPMANISNFDRQGNSKQQGNYNNTVVNQTFNMPSGSNARETAAQVGAKQRQALDAIARRNFN